MGRGDGRGSEGTPPAVPLADMERLAHMERAQTPPTAALSPVEDERSGAAPPSEDVAAARRASEDFDVSEIADLEEVDCDLSDFAPPKQRLQPVHTGPATSSRRGKGGSLPPRRDLSWEDGYDAKRDRSGADSPERTGTAALSAPLVTTVDTDGPVAFCCVGSEPLASVGLTEAHGAARDARWPPPRTYDEWVRLDTDTPPLYADLRVAESGHRMVAPDSSPRPVRFDPAHEPIEGGGCLGGIGLFEQAARLFFGMDGPADTAPSATE